MQALGNVWDVSGTDFAIKLTLQHKTAVARALSEAQPVVSGRMEQFMNNWGAS